MGVIIYALEPILVILFYQRRALGCVRVCMCAFVCVRVGMYESVCIEKKYRKSVEKIYTCKKILVLPALRH